MLGHWCKFLPTTTDYLILYISTVSFHATWALEMYHKLSPCNLSPWQCTISQYMIRWACVNILKVDNDTKNVDKTENRREGTRETQIWTHELQMVSLSPTWTSLLQHLHINHSSFIIIIIIVIIITTITINSTSIVVVVVIIIIIITTTITINSSSIVVIIIIIISIITIIIQTGTVRQPMFSQALQQLVNLRTPVYDVTLRQHLHSVTCHLLVVPHYDSAITDTGLVQWSAPWSGTGQSAGPRHRQGQLQTLCEDSATLIIDTEIICAYLATMNMFIHQK